MADQIRSEAWTGVGETATIREAIAVFDDPERLESAVSELQSSGIDRSDLSFLAHQSLVERPEAGLRHLAADPATKRDAPVTDTDLRQGRVLGTSLAATIAGLAAAGFVVATGGLAVAAIAAAAAAGSAGAAGAFVGQKLSADEESFVDAQLARGGVLVWVRLRRAETDAEQRVLAVLRRYATQVRIRELRVGTPPGGESGR